MQREFKISLSQEYYSEPVYLSQYDTDYPIIFHVVDKYSRSSGINGLSAKFTGTRKDGLGFTFESTASGSTVSFIINTSLTALAGNAVGEIVFYDANGLYYGSANVQIIVEPAARQNGTIDADTERAQEIAEQIQEIVDNAAAEVKGEAESWAVGQRDGQDVPATDPTYNNNAKYYAQQAKQSAESIGIDATLSQAGKAADAKETGDRIEELKSDLKQKADQTDMLKAFPTDTALGSVASFSDGANVPVKSLVVNIDPVQSGSGDPSPDNVRPISGWSEVNVNACGVNIWDEQWEVGLISVSNGQNITGSGIRSKNYSSCTPSTEYRFVFNSGTSKYVFWYDAEQNYIYNNAVTDNTVRFTSPPNAKYFKLRADTISTYNNDFSVNYPSTDTDYHPYDGQSINIALGQTVYGGKLDVVSGVLTVEYEHLLFDGSENLSLQSINSHGIANFTKTTSIPNYTKPIDLICNRLPLQTSSIAETITEGVMLAGDTDIYIRVNSSRASTVEELKQWLTSNNVEVAYKIRTPLTIQLTPHEVTALLGPNNLWTDTGDSTVEYRADPTLYIGRLTEPDADMVADANITSGQYFMVGNTLYKATANIASGATISPNVNCTRKSLSEALNELNS